MNNESESFVILCKPREGLTDADVQAYEAARKEDAKLIDPENCDLSSRYVDVVDPYGLFEGLSACIGRELFVRNLPDGSWVWVGDLPEETYRALMKTMSEPPTERRLTNQLIDRGYWELKDEYTNSPEAWATLDRVRDRLFRQAGQSGEHGDAAPAVAARSVDD